MPEGLTKLVDRSLRLHERVLLLDSMIVKSQVTEVANENPVANQLDQLARAFAAR
jgi:hypothetical protein